MLYIVLKLFHLHTIPFPPDRPPPAPSRQSSAPFAIAVIAQSPPSLVAEREPRPRIRGPGPSPPQRQFGRPDDLGARASLGAPSISLIPTKY